MESANPTQQSGAVGFPHGMTAAPRREPSAIGSMSAPSHDVEVKERASILGEAEGEEHVDVERDEAAYSGLCGLSGGVDSGNEITASGETKK